MGQADETISKPRETATDATSSYVRWGLCLTSLPENRMETNLRGFALSVSVPLSSIQGFRMSLCPDIPGPDAELLLHPLFEGLSFA